MQKDKVRYGVANLVVQHIFNDAAGGRLLIGPCSILQLARIYGDIVPAGSSTARQPVLIIAVVKFAKKRD